MRVPEFVPFFPATSLSPGHILRPGSPITFSCLCHSPPLPPFVKSPRTYFHCLNVRNECKKSPQVVGQVAGTGRLRCIVVQIRASGGGYLVAHSFTSSSARAPPVRHHCWPRCSSWANFKNKNDFPPAAHFAARRLLYLAAPAN